MAGRGQEGDEEARDREEGVIVPFERINPATLRTLIGEFVTREWSELTHAGSTREKQIDQVLRQLQEGKVVVVFDLRTESCNLVAKGSLPPLPKEDEDV